MNFGRREKSAQPNGLFTGDGLREMLERKKYYAVDEVFSSTASPIDSSIYFAEHYWLTGMNVQYRGIVRNVLTAHKVEV